MSHNKRELIRELPSKDFRLNPIAALPVVDLLPGPTIPMTAEDEPLRWFRISFKTIGFPQLQGDVQAVDEMDALKRFFVLHGITQSDKAPLIEELQSAG